MKTDTTTRPEEKQEHKTRRIPPHNLILYNDDHHSVEFVIATLRKTLGCNEQKAILLTLEAHHKGRAIIWTGTKEVAELKQEQLHSFHEIRERDHAKLGPLTSTIEPAPGA